MARPLRIEYTNAWYHILNRGRRGEPIFTTNRDYSGFIELLKDSCEMWKMRVAAYCLMPNHYHLLVQTPNANIARCMRHIDGVYTQRFNRNHLCDGQLFRGRYKSILIDANHYILQLVRYIHRNPLKAGLIDNMDRYMWSSHRGYLSNSEKWNWIYKDFVFLMLSKNKNERLKNYRQFISVDDEEDISQILDKKKWPAILGSAAFINKVKERFFSEKIDDEIPQFRELTPESDQIKKVVCDHYGISEKELLISKRGLPNEPRNMAIYLTRRLRGDSLKTIGEQFQVKKYSSVSSVIGRLNAAMVEDRKLRKRVEKFILNLSKSQEQT